MHIIQKDHKFVNFGGGELRALAMVMIEPSSDLEPLPGCIDGDGGGCCYGGGGNGGNGGGGVDELLYSALIWTRYH